jgi:hypothetical protein
MFASIGMIKSFDLSSCMFGISICKSEEPYAKDEITVSFDKNFTFASSF